MNEKSKKAKKKGDLFIRLGLLLIAAALLLTAYNIFSAKMAGEKAEVALQTLKADIQTIEEESVDIVTADNRPLYEQYPDMEMPLVEIDGETYIGILSLPSLGVELPVKGDFSYKALLSAPCRYYGSVYLNNMIICAHNYNSHFGRLKNLQGGDRVSFTDGDGNQFLYSVAEIVQVNGSDVDAMKNGEWDLTLFTCTLNGRERVAVRLDKVEQ